MDSLWYVLAIVTGQTDSRPPKSMPSRILSFAFWAFIVLMLATFTSNLCEFPGLFSFNFETKKVWDLNWDRQGDRHQKVAPKQFY